MLEPKTHKDKSREALLRDQLTGLLPRMRRFARGLARDPDRADDLVQEACERALKRLGKFRDGTRLDSWIYRIIYTRWIDRLRRGKIRSAHLTIVKSAGQDEAPEGRVERSLETAMDLKAALASLPEDHQAAILLVAVEGFSYSEAAAVMAVPPGTMASRVARARDALNRFLGLDNRRKIRTVVSGNSRRQ